MILHWLLPISSRLLHLWITSLHLAHRLLHHVLTLWWHLSWWVLRWHLSWWVHWWLTNNLLLTFWWTHTWWILAWSATWSHTWWISCILFVISIIRVIFNYFLNDNSLFNMDFLFFTLSSAECVTYDTTAAANDNDDSNDNTYTTTSLGCTIIISTCLCVEVPSVAIIVHMSVIV